VINEYISSDVLIQSLKLYEAKWLSTFPKDEELEYEFSDSFNKKMDKLINRQKKPYYIIINTVGKRVAIIILSIIVSLSAMTMSIRALRDPVIDFVIEVYEKFSTVFFDNKEEQTNYPTEILTKYEPTAIPEGYTKSTAEDFPLSYSLKYTDNNGDILSFMQYPINSLQINLNTENAATEYININEYTGIYCSNKDYQMILWDNGEYAFYMSSKISKEELLVIAESVQIKK